LTAEFTIDLATALWLGFVGACIGSFLNVVAYRMPRGISIVWKPSHCPQCGHPIRARDNVPVLGWLVLRGKCRDCGKPISPRYAIVEAAMGATFFLLAYVELFSGGANLPGGPISAFTGAADIVWNPQWPVIGVYLYHCFMFCSLMGMLLIHRDGKPVPRKLFAGALAVGILSPVVWRFLYPVPAFSQLAPENLLTPLATSAAGLVVGVLPWLFVLFVSSEQEQEQRILHYRNLLRMYAVTGLFLGWQVIISVLLLAMLTGAVLAFGRKWWKKCAAPIGDLKLFVITLLVVTAWRPLTELFPW